MALLIRSSLSGLVVAAKAMHPQKNVRYVNGCAMQLFGIAQIATMNFQNLN
jgi:hypothetical protein